ncbi:MAG: hypothetical protein HLUCCA08_11620 [Rhodobacteraceae bacterium HLUCCA08]|nr:MAG: hypothetical protein HLUCCA08_11620 [Rhodobacteraceae bacterium HLUCCA08]
MPRALHIGLVYALAFAGGLGTAYAVARLELGALMRGGGTALRWLPPLAGVSAFALIYGIGRGRALRLAGWVAAAALVGLAQWVSFALTGANRMQAAQILPVVLVFAPGLALALWRDRA